MINHILIITQVEIINFLFKSSYIFISSMSHQEISTHNIYIIMITKCTAGVHSLKLMFIKLFSTYIMDSTYIGWLHVIYFIITPFKPKSIMFQHGSSIYNISTTYISTCLARDNEHKHLIQELNHQIKYQQ